MTVWFAFLPLFLCEAAATRRRALWSSSP